METKIVPKKENEGLGFTYTVTDEQIREHKKRSVEEILIWLETTARFIYEIQTEEERKRMRAIKCDKNFRYIGEFHRPR